MNGYKAYKYYLALKLHFTTDRFDAIKAHGAIKYPRQKFESRNDRFIFEKLAKRFSSDKELIQFIASNFMYGNPDVIYSGSESDENYTEYLKRKQSITNIFNDDCDNIICWSNSKSVFDCTNNKLPYIITLYLANKVTIETMVILNARVDYIHDLKMENQTLFKMFQDPLRVIEKAVGFVKYSRDKTDPIFDDFLEELKS